MARPRVFQRQTRSPRRLTSWGVGPQAVRTAVSSIGKTLWTTGVILGIPAGTLVRTRGEVGMSLSLATNAGDGFNGAVGIGIVTTDAFDIGVTAVPGPFSDPDWEGWLWHSYWSLRGVAAQSLGQDVARNAVGGELKIPIDSKAMRKWSENETMIGVLEAAVETGVSNMNFVADTRLLVKLA